MIDPVGLVLIVVAIGCILAVELKRFIDKETNPANRAKRLEHSEEVIKLSALFGAEQVKVEADSTELLPFPLIRTPGGRLITICPKCNKLIHVNKFILGKTHFCL
jgi:hypothetical protein